MRTDKLKSLIRRPSVAVPTGLAVAIVLGLLVLFAFRTHIAEGVIAGRIEERGVPEVRLRVTELGLSRILISDLTLGAADELQAREIEATYGLGALLADGAGGISRIRVAGLGVRADLTGDGPPLGSLQPLLAGPEDDGPPLSLPPIALKDVRVAAQTPLGAMTVTADGEAWSPEPGASSVSLALQLQSALGQLSGTLHAAAAPGGNLDGSLIIEDGSVSLPADETGMAAEIGGLTGGVIFAAAGGRPEAVTAELALSQIGLQEGRFRAATVSFDLTEQTATADVAVEGEDGLLSLQLGARADDFLGIPRVALELAAAASTEAAIFDLMAMPLRQGRGRLDLRAAGKLAPFAELAAAEARSPAAILAWLGGARLDGEATLTLEEIAYPGRFERLGGQAVARTTLAEGALYFELPGETRLEAAALNREWLAAAGVPREIVAVLGDSLSLQLPVRENRPMRVALRTDGESVRIGFDGLARIASATGEAPGLAADLAARGSIVADRDLALVSLKLPEVQLTAQDLAVAGQKLSKLEVTGAVTGAPGDLGCRCDVVLRLDRFEHGDVRARNVELNLPLQAGYLNGAVELLLEGRGRVRARQVAQRGGVALTSPLALTMTQGMLLLSPESAEGTGGGRLAHDIALAPAKLSLAAPRQGGPAVDLDVELGALRFKGEQEIGAAYSGRAELSDGAVTLPGERLRLEGISADARFEGAIGVPKTSFKIKRVRDLSITPRLPLVGLSGSVQPSGRRIFIEGEGEFTDAPGPEGPVVVVFTGQYDLSSGAGKLSLRPMRFGFTPGSLQPGDLVPALGELREVSGSAELSAEAQWRDGSLTGNAVLRLQDLSLKREDLKLEGLNLELRLDSLMPPTSPPDQRLEIRRLEAFMPVETLEASFRLLPGEPAKAEIARLGFTFAGGRFEVRDALVDPTSRSHEAVLDVPELELGALFKALEIEGLSGSGLLQGAVPVGVEDEAVIIAGGRLESQAPGVLSYRSEVLVPSLPPDADALELLNEPLDLALRAMENFHYDRLTVAIDKDAAGEASIKLQLVGKNPELLDGYPFNLNINLSGNVAPLLDALQKGLTLSQELLGETWTFGE